MNPTIKKFWEDAGYQVFDVVIKDHTYWSVKPTTGGNVVAVSIGDNTKYYIKPGEVDTYFSEAEMLRLINLKAFL